MYPCSSIAVVIKESFSLFLVLPKIKKADRECRCLYRLFCLETNFFPHHRSFSSFLSVMIFYIASFLCEILYIVDREGENRQISDC